MAGTLTLSTVEQSAVHRHLDVQYGRLCTEGVYHDDCVILHAIMVRLEHGKTIGLTDLETVTLIRTLRRQHLALEADMMALEERRMRGGHNGALDAAYRALDADATMLADVIRRLWEML